MQIELDAVDRIYQADKKQAAREFEEKKTEIKENLLLELEDKKKIVEIERFSLELTGDSMEVCRIYLENHVNPCMNSRFYCWDF